MGMILKLIILVLIAIILYFGLKFAFKLVLSQYAEVEGQQGISTFDQILVKRNGLEIRLKNTQILINLLGLFSRSAYLFWFDAESIEANISSFESFEGNPDEPKQELSFDFVHTTLLSLLGYTLIKKIRLAVQKLSLNLSIFDLTIGAKGLFLNYANENGGKLNFKYDAITIDHKKFGNYSFASADYTLTLDQKAVAKLINFTNSIYSFSIDISDFNIETKNKTLTIHPFSIIFTLYPGIMTFNFPKFDLTLLNIIPSVNILVEKIGLNFVYPIYPIRHFNCDNLYIDIYGFKVSCVTKEFFSFTKLTLLQHDLTQGNPSISIGDLRLDYSTLDGLELFQIIPKLRGNKPYTPTRITFDFPELDAHISNVKVIFRLTDEAKLTGSSLNVSYKDRVLTFPDISMNLNDVEMFTLRNFQILSEDKTFLDFKASYFAFHDQNKVDVAEFINHFTYCIKVLKPYISSNQFDSETLPFPVRITVDEARASFDDSLLNNTLLNVTKHIPEFMRDSVVLKYILQLKMEQCPLTDYQTKMANERVGDLIFKNYRKIVEKIKKYDKVTIIGEKLWCELDSREFTGMVGKIHEFDPTVKEHYPDVGWETLEGFNSNLTADNFEVRFIDLPEPVISMKSVHFKSPVVFGEVDVHSAVPVPFTVGGQPFIADKTPADVKIYCDAQFKSEVTKVFWGTGLAKVYDDFGDIFGALFPDGVDPSPALMWWDKMRSQFRGKYSFMFDKFVLELLGSSNIYDMKNKMSCNFENCFIKFSEGKINLSTTNFDAVRCENGPVIIHMPKFSMVITIEWIQENGDQHKHICFPDTSKFDDPENDTYKPFRSSGFDIDFDIHYENDEFTPFVSVDFAHLEWNIAPIMMLINSPPLDEVYKYKYGVKRKKPVKVMKLAELNRAFTYRYEVEGFTLRIFDHFPAMEDSMINGTSFDIAFVGPKFNCRTEFPFGGEDIYDITLMSNSIFVNLTDLKDIAKSSDIKSSTIMKIDGLDMTYGISSKVSVAGIKLYFNQICTKYIYELVMSIIHIRNKIVVAEAEKKAKAKMQEHFNNMAAAFTAGMEKDQPSAEGGEGDLLKHLMKRRTSQRIATVFGQEGNEKKSSKQDINQIFTKLFYTVNIPLIEIVAESMRYETCFLARIVESELQVKYNQDSSLMLVNFTLNQLELMANTGFNTQTDERPVPIATMNNCSCVYYQTKPDKEQWNDHIINIKVDRMTCDANTNHIASIKYMVTEIMPEFPQSEKTLEMAADDYFSLKADFEISQCQISLRDQFKVDMTSVVISRILGHFVNTLKGNSDATITFDNIFANDTRKDASFGGVVLMRWMDLTSDDSPHLRLQMRKGPPVGGVTVYNHVEMNIDPTVFNYDAEFVNAVRQMFEANIIAPEIVHITKFIEESPVSLPPVLVPKGLLPKIGDSCKDFLIAVKSAELNVMVKRAETNFLMRYFKVTDTKMNVSYKNEENSIISEISEFNGELHDIIYQDLTTTFGDLVNKFIQTVTLDMIPQFLKHMIGLGKISRDKENDLQTWLNKDGGSNVFQKKKQLIFGKSNQK